MQSGEGGSPPRRFRLLKCLKYTFCLFVSISFLFFYRGKSRVGERGREGQKENERETEREREGERGRILRKLRAQRGAPHGAQSHNPGIMT